MKWTVLGTSSGRPTPRRNLSAGALQLDGLWVLFDCGEGTQYQLLRTDLRLSRLRYVFVTHMHGDHILGLPGLLGTLNLARHDQPVDVYGPPGIVRYLREVSRATYFRPMFELNVHEVEPGTVVSTDQFTVEAARLDHRVVAHGYSLTECDRPGRFRLEDARRLGIPEGPLYGRLQRGEQVTLDDGRVIEPSDVVDPQRSGLRVAYVTDTGPTDAAVGLARNADLLVHEATYTTELESEARDRGHSTAADAATVARRANARHLVITHYSPRYEDPRPLLAEARAIFPNTTAARDLLEVDIAAVRAPGDAVPAV
ncbi:MAG TPA: ribonuclease Z [Blastocatellia bacterium]|nr:ribonuclease Z [Blastocatellia bacterium]